VTDPDKAQQLLDDGFTFVACGIDVGILARGADALVAKLKG
jgi:4-hydroxy-2-oxoheptanedioate aldolase